MLSAPEFIGPLTYEDQLWSETVLRNDRVAATASPLTMIIQQREAQITAAFQHATLLLLCGDERAARDSGFRAIAELRALAEFIAGRPEHCVECFVLGTACASHRQALDDSAISSPEWRRFGPDGSPSAAG